MKKIGYFFYSFLPLIFTVALQFLLSIPMTGIGILVILLSQKIAGNSVDILGFSQSLTNLLMNKNFTAALSVVYAISAILIFGIWYFKEFRIPVKQHPKVFLQPKIFMGVILMVPALQILTSYLTSFVAALFPSWMEYYVSLLEASGLSDSPGLLLGLYAVLFGPIAEEFTFRGVALQSAKRAMPFWAANILQATLFGIFHMNMIQGIYAFFVGLFCGYVYEKSGSIYTCILLHMLFNAWGVFFPTEWLSLGGMDTVLSSCLLIISSVFLMLGALTLFTKGQEKINT